MSFFDTLRRLITASAGDREKRQREFVAANTGWGNTAVRAKAAATRSAGVIDREGLQAAFLDQSGRIAYFLDLESGDVVEQRGGGDLSGDRYRRVPPRAADADREERRAFVQTMGGFSRDRVAAVVDDVVAFRKAIASDRSTERAWYIFRNDRASAAMEKWLREIGA